MNRYMKRVHGMEECSIFLLLTVAVAVLSFSVGASVAFAQENTENVENTDLNDVETLTSEEMKERGIPEGGIQIAPTKFVWDLTEGEVKEGRVIVKNYSDKEQYVTMEVEDFFVQDDGRTPQIYTPDNEHPLKALDVISWITPPEAFAIPAGGAKAVEFTVRVPDGQPTNGYYGTLLFRTGGGDPDAEGARIGLSYRIGALVIMAVQGDEPMIIEGNVVDFYPQKKIFWDTPAVLFTKLTNTGNIHFPVFGEIEIMRFGKMFHKIEMTPRLLYPQKTVDLRDIMEFGIFDFGKYSARVALHSEDNSIQMEKATTFYIIPWKLLVLVAVGLVVLFIIWKLFRTYVHIGRRPQKHKKK
jgi:hypothetical protein